MTEGLYLRVGRGSYLFFRLACRMCCRQWVMSKEAISKEGAVISYGKPKESQPPDI